MNVNSLILATLKPLIPNNDIKVPQPPNIVHGKYTGTSTLFCTYNYVDDRGEIFADNVPIIDIAYMQIHLFCPGLFNFNTLKKQIRSALFGAGFSYPRITTLYEEDTNMNHIVFECEIEGKSETEE